MADKKTKDIQNFEQHDSESPAKPAGNNYLLAIAINKYIHAPKLANCVKDAEDFITQLTDRYQFAKERVFRLFDEQATTPNIYKELQSLSKRIGEHDSLVIYYSGHGYFDPSDKSGHLVPVDAAQDAVWSYISNANLLSRIRAIKSFHTFLIVDSCFSGSLILTKNMDSTALAESVGHYPSRWGLAAGRIEEVEDGFHGENSPFSQAILSFLKNNKATKFPVSDLIQHVKRITPHNARQTPVGGPLFKVGDSGGEFIFELQKDEAADWKETINRGTVAAYQFFLTTYPEGQYTAEAKTKIRLLNGEILWKKIEQAAEANIASLNEKYRLVKQYVTEYSDQSHYKEALNVGELLSYKKEFLQAKNSEFALMRFLGKPAPGISGAAAVKEEAQQLLTKWNKADKEQKEKAERKKAEQEKPLENKRIAEEARKKQQQEEKARKALAQKNKATADRKKEKERLAAEAKKKLAKPIHQSTVKKPVKKDSDTGTSFKRNLTRYLLLVLFLSLLIWAIPKILPNIGNNSTILNSEMTAYKDKQSQLWGFKKGTIIAIPANYYAVNDFKNGEAKVIKDGQTFFINNKGKCVRECPKAPISIGTPVDAYKLAIKKGNEALNLKTPDVVTAQGHFERAKKIAEKNKFDKGEAVAGLRKCAMATKKIKEEEEKPNDKIKSITKAYKLGLKTGTFKDSRDDKSYKWVRLKDGKKWMAQNLNYKSSDAFCYDNLNNNCHQYGRLYTWKAAKRACPSGWRLPSDAEWRAMAKQYGGCDDDATDKGKAAYKALIEGGSSGFSALLGGNRGSGGSYGTLGGYGHYWSSTGNGSDNAWLYNFSKPYSKLGRDSSTKAVGRSCRCVQD